MLSITIFLTKLQVNYLQHLDVYKNKMIFKDNESTQWYGTTRMKMVMISMCITSVVHTGWPAGYNSSLADSSESCNKRKDITLEDNQIEVVSVSVLVFHR